MSDKNEIFIRRTRAVMASFIGASQAATSIQEEGFFLDILAFDELGEPVREPAPEGSPEGTLGPIKSALRQEDFVAEFADVDRNEFLEGLAGMLQVLASVDPRIVKLLYKMRAVSNLPPNTLGGV